MKKTLLFILFCFAYLLIINYNTKAQISYGGTPPGFYDKSISQDYDIRDIKALDIDLVKKLDLENEQSGGLYLNGRCIDVNLNNENAGTWFNLSDGSKLWKLTIKSKGALGIAVFYDKFYLPAGGKLFLYNKDKTQFIGAFTELNNPANGLFANEFIQGDVVTFEYIQSANVEEKPDISISQISYAYRDVYFPFMEKNKKDKGECYVDINCSQGQSWQDQKRGVARIQVKIPVGTGWCTGSLINNARNDCTPFFITADHCTEGISDLTSLKSYLTQWVFYFNYEYSGCGTGSVGSNTMTGATFKALADPIHNSDFLLIQLNQNVPQSYNPYFNGWSRSEVPSPNGANIHHPGGTVKKLSLYSTPAMSIAYYQGNPATHWAIQYSLGDSEPGSSGSPLFDNNKRVIGTLTGGTSECGGVGYDGFGKFSYHWDYINNSSQRIKDWIDPDDVDFTEIDGSNYPCSQNTNINANFKADKINISIGEAVNFTDYSIGNPTSWNWVFDGASPSSSKSQNPSNIYYNTAGLYSVTLTATNSYSSNVKTKISYITVTEGECKKTNYPITGTLWTMRAYFDNSFFGYVSGNNKGKDKAKADYFSLNSSFPYIMGAYFTIGKATKKTSGDVNVTFNVWSSVSGKPGSIIASANASLATLVSDYQNTKDTYIQFDYPVKVTGGYFVGVVLPTNAGDTVALKSNHQNESITNTAWELWSDNTWHAYDESGCWGFKLSNAIYPYLCDTYTDISKKNHPLFPDFIIYPNPANDKINIQFNKTLYSISLANYSFNIYNTLGSIVKTGLLNDNSIDIKNLPVGFYYLKLSNENSSFTKKFFITN